MHRFYRLSLFSVSLPSSPPEHVQWDDCDHAVPSGLVLLVGRGFWSVCPERNWTWSQLWLWIGAALEGAGGHGNPWSSEDGYAPFCGGTLNIYFPSISYSDFEGHRNGILKFSIWLVREKVGRVDVMGAGSGGALRMWWMPHTGSSWTSPPTCSVSGSWARGWGTWAKTLWASGFTAGGEMAKQMASVVLCYLLW